MSNVKVNEIEKTLLDLIDEINSLKAQVRKFKRVGSDQRILLDRVDSIENEQSNIGKSLFGVVIDVSSVKMALRQSIVDSDGMIASSVGDILDNTGVDSETAGTEMMPSFDLNASVLASLSFVQAQSDYGTIVSNIPSMARYSFIRSLRTGAIKVKGNQYQMERWVHNPDTNVLPFDDIRFSPTGRLPPQINWRWGGIVGTDHIGYQISDSYDGSFPKFGLGRKTFFRADFDREEVELTNFNAYIGVQNSCNYTYNNNDVMLEMSGTISYVTGDNFLWAANLTAENLPFFGLGYISYRFFRYQLPADTSPNGVGYVFIPIKVLAINIGSVKAGGDSSNALNVVWTVDADRDVLPHPFAPTTAHYTFPDHELEYLDYSGNSGSPANFFKWVWGKGYYPGAITSCWGLGDLGDANEEMEFSVKTLCLPKGFYDPDYYGFSALGDGNNIDASVDALLGQFTNTVEDYSAFLSALPYSEQVAYRDKNSVYKNFKDTSKWLSQNAPVFLAIPVLTPVFAALMGVSVALSVAGDITKYMRGDLNLQSLCGLIIHGASTIIASAEGNTPEGEAQWQVAVSKDIHREMNRRLEILSILNIRGGSFYAFISAQSLSGAVLPGALNGDDTLLVRANDYFSSEVAQSIKNDVPTVTYAHTNCVVVQPLSDNDAQVALTSSVYCLRVMEGKTVEQYDVGNIDYQAIFVDSVRLVYVAAKDGLFGIEPTAGNIQVRDNMFYRVIQPDGSKIIFGSTSVLKDAMYKLNGRDRNRIVDAVFGRVIATGPLVKTTEQIDSYVATMKEGSYRLFFENCHIHSKRMFDFVTKGSLQKVDPVSKKVFSENYFNKLKKRYEVLDFSNNLVSLT